MHSAFSVSIIIEYETSWWNISNSVSSDVTKFIMKKLYFFIFFWILTFETIYRWIILPFVSLFSWQFKLTWQHYRIYRSFESFSPIGYCSALLITKWVLFREMALFIIWGPEIFKYPLGSENLTSTQTIFFFLHMSHKKIFIDS
jgi:hypothetical protein